MWVKSSLLDQGLERAESCERADRLGCQLHSGPTVGLGHPSRDGQSVAIHFDFIAAGPLAPAGPQDLEFAPLQRMPRIMHCDNPRIAGIML